MNFLQRMPQSAKVALAAVLLVGTVAVWYLAFFRPSQATEQALITPTPTEPSAPLTTARPLEVLPVPFLVTEATRTEQPKEQEEAPTGAVVARPQVAIPPNPFVPLIIETTASLVAQPSQPTASIPERPAPIPVAPQPIPQQTARVQIRQPVVPLPRPSLPGTRPTLGMEAAPTPTAQPRLAQGTARTAQLGTIGLDSGALPIRLPLIERELGDTTAAPKAAAALDIPTEPRISSSLEFARAEINARLAQVLEPKSSLSRAQETVQESPLARFVREQNLRLSGVVLGPTSVAIFQSKNGFTVLAVGQTLPGSDVLLKSLSAKEALLVQGSQSLNLTIDSP